MKTRAARCDVSTCAKRFALQMQKKLVRCNPQKRAAMGYKSMLLDTLPSMLEAHKLYRMLGFREISSYQKNPVPGALFLKFSCRWGSSSDGLWVR